MHRVADDYRTVSVRLSRILGDVGVNQDMVLRRRRTYILEETLETIGYRVSGRDVKTFIFGSQTEGTTSPGLGSDIDILCCMKSCNIIQEWDNWQYGKVNLLMIRDDTTGPGYCRLQQLSSTIPLPVTHLPDTADKQYYAMDSSGRILYKHTKIHDTMRVEFPDLKSIDGPAGCRNVAEEFFNTDTVFAFPCQSWPHEARQWIRRRRRHWPSLGLVQKIENIGCFVVPKGQKGSEHACLEWRISTSLAERMLMFSMNITQIQCYFSLKMIIQTFVTDQIGKIISSYHCKTVIFYCIENTSPELWIEEQLFVCIKHCLQQLCSYIYAGHLPNYFIPRDNLLADRIDLSTKRKLVDILTGMLKGSGEHLFRICIDDIGYRLLNSFNMIPAVHLCSRHTYCTWICTELAVDMYRCIGNTINNILHHGTSSLSTFSSIIGSLISLARRGTNFQKSAAGFLLPSLCSSLGSMMAALDISRGRDLSPAVMTLFQYGVQSDAASSRLKLASILYCRGELRAAALFLQDIEQRCGRSEVEPRCGCYNVLPDWASIKEGFRTHSFDVEGNQFRDNVSYCVRFMPSEIACTPLEMRYEMYRSFGDEVQYRGPLTRWMDWAVVDSLPFLHFLQYLVFRQLQSCDLQQRALYNLTIDIKEEKNLCHRETALNLLGKCLEQENRFNEAGVCYALSLRIRPRNNAANFHFINLIYRLNRLLSLLTGI